MIESASYQDGIDRAKKKGHIKRYFSTSDGYSHSNGVDQCNSRGLNPIAQEILRAFPKQQIKKVAEIGPGSMVAASAMSILRPEAKIHTAGGLTPANPYWRFSQDILFSKDAENTVAGTVRRKLLKIEAPEAEKICHSPDELMAIQEKYGIKIFDVLKEPYVELQWADKFPDYCALENGKYDFVYENCGPNWHMRNHNVGMATYDLLSPQGILCMNSASPLDREDPWKAPFVVTMNGWHFTVNRDNFLAPYIEERRREGKEFDKTYLDKVLTNMTNKPYQEASVG